MEPKLRFRYDASSVGQSRRTSISRSQIVPIDREKLLKKAVAGDEFAQQELLDEYLPFIKMHLQKLVGKDRVSSDEDLDDVASTTCMEVFQRLPDFEFREGGVAGFEKWLQRIAEHRLFDARGRGNALKRGGGWNPATPSDAAVLESINDVIDLFAADPMTASRKVSRNEARTALEAALQYLKEVSNEKSRDYYEAFRLHFIEGKTVPEVVEELGATDGVVRNLLRTACNLLQAHLGSLSLYLTRKS